MGNETSTNKYTPQEKQAYLHAINQLTQQNNELNNKLRKNMNGINNSGVNDNGKYDDTYKTNLLNQIQMQQLQKQVLQNQLEIQQLSQKATQGYKSSYQTFAEKQPGSLMNNPEFAAKVMRNPYLLKELLNKQPQDQPQSQPQPQNQYQNQRQPQQNQNQSQNQYQRQPQAVTFKHIQNEGIRDYNNIKQDSRSGNSEIVHVDTSLESKSNSYYYDEKKARLQYELDEKKRRMEFEEQQKRRREEFQRKLQEFEQGPMDALNLFQLPPNYDLETLNKAYKRLALKTHPDKPGGSAELFSQVTKSYLLLMEKHKQQHHGKSFHEMKAERNAESYTKADPGAVSKEKFNSQMFNKIYEENRLYSVHDEGYGDWFSKDGPTKEMPQIFSDKFNLNVFNSVFEQMNGDNNSDTQIVESYGPNSLICKNSNMGFTTLGETKLDNFGKSPNAGKTNEVSYCDLKEAYSNKFFNPNTVKRKDYKSVEELKTDRANISYIPDEHELRRQELVRQKEELEEQRRLAALRGFDSVANDHYTKVHNRLLGYNPDLQKQLEYKK